MSPPSPESWGRNLRVPQRTQPVYWRTDSLAPPPVSETLLPYGNGRSYGDVCLNAGGTLLTTRTLDRFIAFDDTTGVLSCEAGVLLQDILALVVPKGWFLPVTPGTQLITLGGAIANDVHGKNHHRAGTFGQYVRRLELLRTDGRRIQATPSENTEWYVATIGGLGLTGLIVSADLQLRRVDNSAMKMETLPFGGLDEFFELSQTSDAHHEYTVAWLDCLSSGKSFGRGLFFRGDHADASERRAERVRAPNRRKTVPFDLPSSVLNPFTLRAFNGLYYQTQRRRRGARVVHYEPFFYPLDAVRHWNRVYGRRGFFQFQCVLPRADARRTVHHVLEAVVRSGLGSFLAVLKTFGDVPSLGLLSFARPGVTLALDFPNRGEETLELLRSLDRFTAESGGAVYPAKDSVMSQDSFQTYFPEHDRFFSYVDPAFSSSFWRRVNGLTEPGIAP